MSLQNIPQNTPQILVSFFINLHTISKTVGDEKILKKYPHFTATDYITEDRAADIILGNIDCLTN